MREMFIVTAEGISKEDLEKFCKRKDPQAEVLQDRKDMVATYWEPDDVREYYEYDTGDAVSLTDKECISLLVDAYRHDEGLGVSGLEERTGVFSEYAGQKAGKAEGD